MTTWRQYLEDPEQFEGAFRLFDFPMHYFAAIQKRNQVNLGRKLEMIGLTPLDWRILAALRENGSMAINDLAEITVFDRFKVSRGGQ
ncbi:MarR family transcriptional regulator [Leisingera thetidis]|uniref:MarR family transcriptional regulator n=1 Tax=Leisingera thetidis TaxID=2930199 RepID=UPI0021F72FBB|nr:helix-turn-helix domain-containing protein [Leisingera thetidis]